MKASSEPSSSSAAAAAASAAAADASQSLSLTYQTPSAGPTPPDAPTGPVSSSTRSSDTFAGHNTSWGSADDPSPPFESAAGDRKKKPSVTLHGPDMAFRPGNFGLDGATAFRGASFVETFAGEDTFTEPPTVSIVQGGPGHNWKFNDITSITVNDGVAYIIERIHTAGDNSDWHRLLSMDLNDGTVKVLQRLTTLTEIWIDAFLGCTCNVDGLLYIIHYQEQMLYLFDTKCDPSSPPSVTQRQFLKNAAPIADGESVFDTRSSHMIPYLGGHGFASASFGHPDGGMAVDPSSGIVYYGANNEIRVFNPKKHTAPETLAGRFNSSIDFEPKMVLWPVLTLASLTVNDGVGENARLGCILGMQLVSNQLIFVDAWAKDNIGAHILLRVLNIDTKVVRTLYSIFQVKDAEADDEFACEDMFIVWESIGSTRFDSTEDRLGPQFGQIVLCPDNTLIVHSVDCILRFRFCLDPNIEIIEAAHIMLPDEDDECTWRNGPVNTGKNATACFPAPLERTNRYTTPLATHENTVLFAQPSKLGPEPWPAGHGRAIRRIVMPEIVQNQATVKLILDYERLFNNPDAMPDVTFKVGGETFYAHTLILNARSDYFKAKLYHGTKKRKQEGAAYSIDTSEFEGVDPSTFAEVMRYIYCTRSKVTGENVLPMLQLASKLRVVGLVDGIVDHLVKCFSNNWELRDFLDWTKIIFIYILACQHDLVKLKDTVFQYCCSELKEFRAFVITEEGAKLFEEYKSILDGLLSDTRSPQKILEISINKK